MRRFVVLLAALLAAGGVFAATGALATSTLDRDDVTTQLDIAKAASSYNRASDQLVTTIDFYDPISPKAMVNPRGGPPSTVCIEIWTRATPGEASPNYEACAGPKAKGKGWVASLDRKRERGPRLRLAALKVQQPNRTRLVMRIDPDDIRRPGSYRWRAEATDFASDCTRSSGCPDYAPDRPATALTKLGSPGR